MDGLNYAAFLEEMGYQAVTCAEPHPTGPTCIKALGHTVSPDPLISRHVALHSETRLPMYWQEKQS